MKYMKTLPVVHWGKLRYTDGTLIDIDYIAVEDEVARNMYERSELYYLLT